MYCYELLGHHMIQDYEGEPTPQRLRGLIWDFTKRSVLHRILISAYSERTELDNFVVVDSHANSKRGYWAFDCAHNGQSIQSFVDSVDGRCLAILLFTCNTGNAEISSRQSIVVHPSRGLNRLALHRRVPLHIHVPDEGYVEGDCRRIRNIVDMWQTEF